MSLSARFRIVPKAPDVYHVQRKWGPFWFTLNNAYAWEPFPHEFTLKVAARAFIDQTIAKEAAIKAHLAQGIEEYP